MSFNFSNMVLFFWARAYESPICGCKLCVRVGKRGGGLCAFYITKKYTTTKKKGYVGLFFYIFDISL